MSVVFGVRTVGPVSKSRGTDYVMQLGVHDIKGRELRFNIFSSRIKSFPRIEPLDIFVIHGPHLHVDAFGAEILWCKIDSSQLCMQVYYRLTPVWTTAPSPPLTEGTRKQMRAMYLRYYPPLTKEQKEARLREITTACDELFELMD